MSVVYTDKKNCIYLYLHLCFLIDLLDTMSTSKLSFHANYEWQISALQYYKYYSRICDVIKVLETIQVKLCIIGAYDDYFYICIISVNITTTTMAGQIKFHRWECKASVCMFFLMICRDIVIVVIKVGMN